ncbi:MAG: hypothetical protein RDU25_05410 [Patescibacteria group bacterium]|nr:hypothetical protein [Patescibacteria group bacterium]
MYSVTLSPGSARLVSFKTDDGVHYKAQTQNHVGLGAVERIVRGNGVFTVFGDVQLGRTGRWFSLFGGIQEFWTASREVAEAVLATLTMRSAA